MLPVSIQSEGNILRLLPMPQSEFEDLYVGTEDFYQYDDLDIYTIEAFDKLVENQCNSINNDLSAFVVKNILKSFSPKIRNINVFLFIKRNILNWFENTSYIEDNHFLKDNRLIIDLEGSEVHIQYIDHKKIQVLYESDEIYLCQLALIDWGSWMQSDVEGRISPLQAA